jgi:hypothetical protein
MNNDLDLTIQSHLGITFSRHFLRLQPMYSRIETLFFPGRMLPPNSRVNRNTFQTSIHQHPLIHPLKQVYHTLLVRPVPLNHTTKLLPLPIFKTKSSHVFHLNTRRCLSHNRRCPNQPHHRILPVNIKRRTR